MTTRYYQIGGVWNTYEYWHDNYGYTTSATFSVNYKQSTADHWGEAANPGYYDPEGSFSIFDWSFWADGIVGWYDINDLAVQGVYPAAAEDIVLERSGEVANAVYLTDDDGTFYLIDGHLSDGWRDWDTLEADGWHVYEGEPSYIVVNESNGKIVHSITSSPMIIVITLSVTIQSFYFTTNGAAETEDTPLPVGDSIPLYWADGSRVDDSAGWASKYDGESALALTKVDGNMFAALPNDKVISVDHSGTNCLDFYGEAEEVVLKVKWGDTVTIPEGFTVTEIRTFVGYAFPSYFSDVSGGKAVAWPEKNVYFDNIDGHTLLQSATGTLGSGTWPLVEVFQCTSLHGASGKYLTVGYRNSTAEWVTQDRLTNGTDFTAGDYSVYLKGNNTTAINDAINSGYPVRFLWFIWDSTQSEWFEAVWWKTPEAFRVPDDLWSFSNGTFSWLGNSEDTSSLAWYYKHDWDGFEMEGFDGVWYYIHCIRYISNRSAYSVQVEKISDELDIDTLYGDQVTIPNGYTVESVKSQRLFVKASGRTYSSGSKDVTLTWAGENEFCDLSDTSVLAMGSAPCLTIFALINTTNGYWLTWRPSTTGTGRISNNLSNKKLNSDNVFCHFTATCTSSSYASNTYTYSGSYPTLFRYYDANDTIVPYFFKIQSSVWQFSGGSFSWIGDTTDQDDLAFWYNRTTVRIHCVRT